MSVPNQVPFASFIGNGSTTTFAYAFRVLDSADLHVTVNGNAVSSALYAVSGIGTDFGSVIFLTAPVAASSVIVYRSTSLNRAIDYQQNGDLLSLVLNSDLDRVWMALQELASGNQAQGNALRVPTGESVPALLTAASRSSKLLAFDSSGNPTLVIPSAQSASALALQFIDPTNDAFGDALVAVRQPFTGAASRTQHDRNRDMVNVFDFILTDAEKEDVRSFAGTMDVTYAIQAALNTGRSVYFPAGVYCYSGTLRFMSIGQVMHGEGGGDRSVGCRTRLKWIGAAGGMMLSFSNGAGTMMQTCRAQDVMLDGNSLAGLGVEAYDDAIAGGAWRNSLRNVSIINCTGVASVNPKTPRALYLGNGSAPNFAHDFILDHVYMSGSSIGIEGAGATHSMSGKCTVEFMSVAGLVANSGSAFHLGDSVFTKNAWDVINTNAQVLTMFGTWCEDSTSGVYKAATGHILMAAGAHLSTLSGTCLMDFGNAAGSAHVIACTVPSGSNNLIININGTSETDFKGSGVLPANGYRARFQGVIRSDQAAFAAGLLNDLTNATGDGTVVVLNTLPWIAEYNLFTYFDVTTGIYSAGLFGVVQFDAQVSLGNLSTSHTDAQLFVTVAGQDYLLDHIDPAAVKTPSNEALLQAASRTVSINPGQTAILKLMVSGGAKTVTVQSGGALTNWRTRFEGRYI